MTRRIDGHLQRPVINNPSDYKGHLPTFIGFDSDSGEYDSQKLRIIQAFSDVMYQLQWVLNPPKDKKNFFNPASTKYFRENDAQFVRKVFIDILGKDSLKPGSSNIAKIRIVRTDLWNQCSGKGGFSTGVNGPNTAAYNVPSKGKPILVLCDDALDPTKFEALKLPQCNISKIAPDDKMMKSLALILLHELT